MSGTAWLTDLRLAVRNLLRNRRRSMATFLALVIGTSSILFFNGYRKNIEYSMLTAYAREGGHLQVQHRDLFYYGTGDPVRYSIDDYRALMQAIETDAVLGPLVTVVTPTLQFGGIASNFAEGVSRTVIAMGQEAAARNRMREWNQYELPMTATRFALDGAPPDAALVGYGVARVLLLCEPLKVENCPPRSAAPKREGTEALPSDVADLAALSGGAPAPEKRGGAPHLDLLASSAGGAPNVVSVEVVRAERQGFKELDEVFMALQLPQAQRLVFGNDEPRVTAIMVQLRDTATTAIASARLREVIASVSPKQPLAVLDYRDINPFFVQTVQMFDTIFGFIFVLIGSIVLFTVGNTMSTAVMERTVEIGTVRALGVRRSGVRRLFVLEGMMLGVAGAVAGALFAIVTAAVVNRLGLTWLPPGSGDRLPLLLVVWGEQATIVGTMVGLMVIAGLSAWWPAYRASKLVIVEALRHV